MSEFFEHLTSYVLDDVAHELHLQRRIILIFEILRSSEWRMHIWCGTSSHHNFVTTDLDEKKSSHNPLVNDLI